MRRLALLAVALTACPRAPPTPPPDAGPPPVVSDEVLGRPVATSKAKVQHILVGWASLAPAYRQPLDPRAAVRTPEQAAQTVREILQRLHTGEPFVRLMKAYSEDRGSASTGQPFVVRPDGQLEPQFQALALRLQKGEVGVCRSAYGYHVVLRVE